MHEFRTALHDLLQGTHAAASALVVAVVAAVAAVIADNAEGAPDGAAHMVGCIFILNSLMISANTCASKAPFLGNP
jgi:hypothetical protein